MRCRRRRFAALYRGTIWLCEVSFQVRLTGKSRRA
jgi:hypothetical protein